jgi:squalene-hopene/tetraprenyl-beta-curcumene cyclase
MATHHLCLLSIAVGAAACVVATPGRAGENPDQKWNKAGAVAYLDSRGAEWYKFGGARRGQGATTTSCVSCHSLLPYALARPVLRRITGEKTPTEYETKVLAQVKSRVANWNRLDTEAYQLFYDFDEPKKKQSRGTEAVLCSLVLALDDRLEGRREPSGATKQALSILWATQITEGEHKGSWDWLNFGLEPWEADGGRYMGAAIAAIAVASARESGYSVTDKDVKERLGWLGDYLRNNYSAQNLHNRVWLLWASAQMDGLLTRAQTDDLVAQLLAKQLPEGGWSLGALGKFARKGVNNNEKSPDGYATGLILHVLQVAGLPKDRPELAKGLAWLRANQDRSGAWRTASVNKNRAPESSDPGKANIGKFMWDAATAYAVLALSH